MTILRLVQNDLRPCPVWRARRVGGPTPDCFLNGLTRQSVIKLAKMRGFEVVERHILEEELPTFSEVFICGSAAEVTPVAEIGEFTYRPGNISLSLMDDYARMVRRQPMDI